jgi:hypothetical protein
MNRNVIYFMTGILFFLTITFDSCKKKSQEPTDFEQLIFDKSTDPALSYYQNNNTLLSAAGNSPHGSFKLRFNSVAQAALGVDGKLPTGGSFPDSSIIVKEVFNGGSLDLYAVMMKLPSHPESGSGWLWAEYEPDGDVIHAISKKGNGCIGCHAGNTNRDLVNSFDLH